ncbi:MAG: hypothetical protein ABIK20_06980 [Candidatus Omnitrophota bacterium]
MDKKELLSQVQNLAAQRLLTKDEVTAAFDAGEKDSGAEVKAIHQKGISHILYYVGGAIVFLGISVLVGQHWSVLSNITKILCTLGSGVAAYIAAVFLSRDERLEIVSGAFYFISVLVMPLGFYVTFRAAGLDVGSYGIQSVVSAILLVTFILSYLAARKTVFTIFNIIFGTWLFFSFASFLVGGNPSFNWQFPVYLVLCAGLVYILLGYYFTGTPHRALTNTLYGFGVFGFLGAALALGNWNPHQNIFWELVFPGLVFGVMFLSVYLKSATFLTFGSLYLMGYILKITSEYFAHSLGWPLALVLTGFGLIAIGYLHFNLKKKYLS